jgi:hypothetical protein
MIRKDLQSRAHYVADCIDKCLKEIADEAANDGWDGRELLAGIGVALGRTCQALQISPADAINMVNRLHLGDEAPRDRSLLIAPNGRPLSAPARRID